MQKLIRTQNIERLIYNFNRSYVMNSIILIKFFLAEVFYDYFRLIYAYLHEKDKFCKCFNSLKIVIQAHLQIGFFTMFFIKQASLKRFYL